MAAGKIAAEVAAKAIKAGNVSREGLWEYNVLYKRGLGSVRPFADGIRLLVQNISHEDIDILCGKDEQSKKENIKDLSDDLSGEIFSEDGWISTYSKYKENF